MTNCIFAVVESKLAEISKVVCGIEHLHAAVAVVEKIDKAVRAVGVIARVETEFPRQGAARERNFFYSRGGSPIDRVEARTGKAQGNGGQARPIWRGHRRGSVEWNKASILGR